MNDSKYIHTLLAAWEDIAKRGQLTLWIMLALKDGPKHMAEIRAFMAEATNGTITVDDQSLYRALRRYHDTEMIDYITAPGNGPDRKVYNLSSIGSQVLERFIERNITGVLYKPRLMQLMKRG